MWGCCLRLARFVLCILVDFGCLRVVGGIVLLCVRFDCLIVSVSLLVLVFCIYMLFDVWVCIDGLGFVWFGFCYLLWMTCCLCVVCGPWFAVGCCLVIVLVWVACLYVYFGCLACCIRRLMLTSVCCFYGDDCLVGG